jgi:hypothetical protein
LKQEELKSKASLGYVVRPQSQKQKKHVAVLIFFLS